MQAKSERQEQMKVSMCNTERHREKERNLKTKTNNRGSLWYLKGYSKEI